MSVIYGLTRFLWFTLYCWKQKLFRIKRNSLNMGNRKWIRRP